MSPNRIAILLGIVQAVAAALLPILGAVTSPLQAIVLCVVVICITALLVIFLIGWMRHEGLAADPTTTVPALPVKALPELVATFTKVGGDVEKFFHDSAAPAPAAALNLQPPPAVRVDGAHAGTQVPA